jgi:hypothetical protein
MSQSTLTIPKTLSPASTVTPLPIPKLMNIYRENMINAKARDERLKSFAANREAA